VEALKNRVVIVLGIVTVIFFLVAVNSCMQSKKCLDVKHKEEILRYDKEQELNKISNEKNSIEEKLRKLETEMAREKTAAETTQKALLQEQLINKSLKVEIDKLSKSKEALKQELDKALVSGGKSVRSGK
jgi:septal ring factor EnvC (AmiA/AmiB activator)